MDITWEEPPVHAKKPGEHKGRYVEFASELAKHPGRWAVLPAQSQSEKGAAATAQNIRRGKLKGFTKGEYETALSGTKIYVRFIAEEDRDGGEDDDAGAGDEQPDRPQRNPDTGEVRAWAAANGYDLPDRGRIPTSVRVAFNEAQKGHAPVHERGNLS